MISYWDSFLGANKTANKNEKKNNLIWSIRNDNSPKVRLIAANTLTVYLESAKAFFTLTAAEDTMAYATHAASMPQSSAAFVPISLSIAYLIRQLHKDLLFSLCTAESFAMNQIQLLKCLQCLIKATPYQKLKPGLIYKLLINLHLLLKQKTPPNLNVHLKLNLNSSNLINEILNTILLIITNHHQLVEVHLALLTHGSKEIQQENQTNTSENLSSKLENLSNVYKVPNIAQSRVTYFYTNENQQFSSLKSSSSLSDSLATSGQITPLFGDLIDVADLKQCSDHKSWLVNYCLTIGSLNVNTAANLDNQHLNRIRAACIECLQVVCRKYFDLLGKSIFFEDLCQMILNIIEFVPNGLANNDLSKYTNKLYFY